MATPKVSWPWTIVDKTDWLASSTNFWESKGVNKAAFFYVEKTVTAHIVLYYVWAQMFLLVRTFCICISIPRVFCWRSRPTHKRNRAQKPITKKLASFIFFCDVTCLLYIEKQKEIKTPHSSFTKGSGVKFPSRWQIKRILKNFECILDSRSGFHALKHRTAWQMILPTACTITFNDFKGVSKVFMYRGWNLTKKDSPYHLTLISVLENRRKE